MLKINFFVCRCNHNFALRCDLQLGLPVWWPNSVQPFAGAIATPSDSPISNFFKSENVIRSEYAAMAYNFGLVADLVDAFTSSGMEAIPDKVQDSDTEDSDYSLLDVRYIFNK